jgi:hypothetical protein
MLFTAGPTLDGLFTSLRAPSIQYCLSLYADDLVVFVAPHEADIALVKAIMDSFAQISSLHTNVSKCQITPILCSDEQVAVVQMELVPGTACALLMPLLGGAAVGVCA